MRALGLSLAAGVMGALVFPRPARAQAEERPNAELSELASSWSAEVEAGCRAWGLRAYRGLHFAPGVWYQVPPGIELGLFAPLHMRVGDRGRVGIDYSIGLEPRFRFAILEHLGGEVAFGIALEDQEMVHGLYSYSAGLNVNHILSLRFTHERYNLEEGFTDSGFEGAPSANYVDVVFTGQTGTAVALAEALVVAVLAAVTGGAK